MDRGAWRAAARGVAEGQTRLRDSAQHSTSSRRRQRQSPLTDRQRLQCVYKFSLFYFLIFKLLGA